MTVDRCAMVVIVVHPEGFLHMTGDHSNLDGQSDWARGDERE